MRVNVVTMFPEFFDGPLQVSIVGRAIAAGILEVNLVDLNWPLGAAMAMGLLGVTLGLVGLSQRLTVSGKRRVVFEGAD